MIKEIPDYVNWGLVGGSQNSYYFRENEIKDWSIFKRWYIYF